MTIIKRNFDNWDVHPILFFILVELLFFFLSGIASSYAIPTPDSEKNIFNFLTLLFSLLWITYPAFLLGMKYQNKQISKRNW